MLDFKNKKIEELESQLTAALAKVKVLEEALKTRVVLPNGKDNPYSFHFDQAKVRTALSQTSSEVKEETK